MKRWLVEALPQKVDGTTPNATNRDLATFLV